jgi:hypothetical protein
MNAYFILATVATLLGPFGYKILVQKHSLSRFFDGLVIAALIGLVTLHILPESLEQGGGLSIIAMLIGLLGPLLLSRFSRKKDCEIQKPFLIISIIGFVAHNMLDGAAIVSAPYVKHSSHLLALAVIIHRFIVSMALWRTLSPQLGKSLSALSLFGLSAAMAVGFIGGEHFISHSQEELLYTLQALAGGMLFHVILHPHHVGEIKKQFYIGQIKIKVKSMGAICGLAFAIFAYLFWPAHSHSTHTNPNFITEQKSK